MYGRSQDDLLEAVADSELIADPEVSDLDGSIQTQVGADNSAPDTAEGSGMSEMATTGETYKESSGMSMPEHEVQTSDASSTSGASQTSGSGQTSGISPPSDVVEVPVVQTSGASEKRASPFGPFVPRKPRADPRPEIRSSSDTPVEGKTSQKKHVSFKKDTRN